jgi:hypothetical protein
VRNARISASAFGLAILLASLWWGAHRTMIILHDDASFVHALTTSLDKPAVRTQLSAWTTEAIRQTAPSTGKDFARNPVIKQLQSAITSKENIGPMADALTSVAVEARDEAVHQLDRRLDPKQEVRLELAPLFTAAKIKIDKATATALGLTLKKDALTSRLLTGDQLDRMQRRYDLTVLTNRWAGWAALALLIVAVVTSAKPLRALAIASGVTAALAIVVPLLLGRFAAWLGRSELGSLAQPLVGALARGVGPYLVPVVVGGLIGAAGFTVAHVLLSRRRARST